MGSIYSFIGTLCLRMAAGDLDDIAKFALLGYSYASGTGAGVRGSLSEDTICSRYSEA